MSTLKFPHTSSVIIVSEIYYKYLRLQIDVYLTMHGDESLKQHDETNENTKVSMIGLKYSDVNFSIALI